VVTETDLFIPSLFIDAVSIAKVI